MGAFEAGQAGETESITEAQELARELRACKDEHLNGKGRTERVGHSRVSLT